MKKFFSVILCVTCALTLLAQAPDGLTCETAIPVDSSYTGSIPAPGVYYYSAWTYDLPLTCYFYPEQADVDTPYLDIDFGCTPSVYEDPNIQELVDETMGWGVEMPIHFDNFIKDYDENGRLYFAISVSEVYRDLMANFGITYDVQALVKVNVNSAGDIYMKPDTAFRSCVESSEWVNLPYTLNASVFMGDDTYVLPLSDWQNDSIRFVWNGTQAPVQLWIGETCDFDLKLTGENAALRTYEIQPNTGQDDNIFVMTRQNIIDLINFADNGGVLYMRVIAAETADLVIEKQPILGPMADAIRLEFNQAAPVTANDVQQVYYFPTSWKVRDLLLTSIVNTPITAYFYEDVLLTKPLGAYDFTTSTDCTTLGISIKELSTMLNDLTSEHTFVTFHSTKNTSIIPSKWDVCTCVQNSSEITPNDSIYVKARNTSTYYRISYDKWSKNDVTLTWKTTGNMRLFLADTCAGYSLTETDEHVLFYHLYPNKSTIPVDSVKITGAQIRAWEDRVDEDGYLYFRFSANRAGDFIVSSIPDPTVEPEDPSTPCVANSIELKKGDELILNLDSAFTVYRIKYDEWITTDASLAWTGAEPLHTFVAETCKFALAPYNKYVHAYVPVPASGNIVLDTTTLTNMAEYVDEDGYLYVRFLTEFEGELTVK